MTRVALCISAHMRNYEVCLVHLTHKLIENNTDFKFDIFIHTWNHRNVGIPIPITEKDVAKYKPKAFVIEEPFEFDTKKYQTLPIKHFHHGTLGEGILAMYYKIKKCNELVTNRNQYDLIIRTRFDICFDLPFDLNRFIGMEGLALPCIGTWTPRLDKYQDVPLYNCFDKTVHGHGGCSDVFAVGTPQAMDYYSSLYDHIDELTAKHGIFQPEALLYQHLHNNVPFSTFENLYHLYRGGDYRVYF